MIIKPAESMDEYVIDTSTMIPDDLEVYDLMKAMQKMFQRKALLKPLDTHIAKKIFQLMKEPNKLEIF